MYEIRLALFLLSLTRTQAFAVPPGFTPHLRCNSLQHTLAPLAIRRASYCSYRSQGYRLAATAGAAAADGEPLKCAPEIAAFVQHLQAIRKLPRVVNNESVIPIASSNHLRGICNPDKPTFRRLFTHETWEMHLGGSGLARWLRTIRGIPSSVIFRKTWPSICVIAAYALAVAFWLPQIMVDSAVQQQLPMSFCGSAIGLLLVFRTNSAYGRLWEATTVWGRMVKLVRDIASKCATSEDAENDRSLSTGTTVDVCRLLVAYMWSMRDELRDGDQRDDILRLLIQDEAEERWIAASLSRPIAIHHRLRLKVHKAWKRKNLADHVIFALETDLNALASATSDCQRIFASPIPPTMSRHGLRCLLLWLLALPVVLAGSVPPVVNAVWTATTAFIYLGIDELGVQVEQPFQILPLWQLCQQTQDYIEHSLSSPERPLPYLTHE